MGPQFWASILDSEAHEGTMERVRRGWVSRSRRGSRITATAGAELVFLGRHEVPGSSNSRGRGGEDDVCVFCLFVCLRHNIVHNSALGLALKVRSNPFGFVVIAPGPRIAENEASQEWGIKPRCAQVASV